MSEVNLLRYNKKAQFVTFDAETEGLNMATNRPWELSWVIGDLKNGITEEKERFIKWDDLRLSPEIAIKTHFNKDEYEEKARPPKDVFNEFLYDINACDYSVGHNIRRFDIGLLYSRMRDLGIEHGDLTLKMLDTLCLMKGLPERANVPFQKGDNLFIYQNRLSNIVMRQKGLNTLQTLCKIMDVDYNESEAHRGIYDVKCNFLAFMKLVHRLDF